MVNSLPPVPHLLPTEKVHQCWQEDELFGYQFLNGANPMLLRRTTSLPTRLVLPSGTEELQAQLEKELQVLAPMFSQHQHGNKMDLLGTKEGQQC